MPRPITRAFTAALGLAKASLGDIARGMGRARRTLTAIAGGGFEATPGTARGLARYLRERARAFQRAARRLEAAADKEEEARRR